MGQPVAPIFMGQAVQEDCLDCLTHEDGNNIVPKCQ